MLFLAICNTRGHMSSRYVISSGVAMPLLVIKENICIEGSQKLSFIQPAQKQ